VIQDLLTRWRYQRALKRYKVVAPEGAIDESLRLYVLVDDSIMPRGGAKTAQVTHAVVELMKRHYPSNERVRVWADTDRTLIILAADASEIARHLSDFAATGRAAEGFLEPDLGNRLTVGAFEPLRGIETEVFAHLERAR
jgi:hypothetical protein